MAKGLKFSISGSYKASNGDVIDFDGVEGVVPFVNEDVATMHVRGRHAVMWVRAATRQGRGKELEPKYPQRIEHFRQIFVDDIEQVEAEFSFDGKDIKEMTYVELQDLATAKDLRTIPLPKELSGTDLREQRAQAYAAYTERVLKLPAIKDVSENFGKLPPLVVNADPRVDDMGRMSNDEVIEIESKARILNQAPKSQLTLMDLRQMATSKNITFNDDTSFDELYGKIFVNVA